MSIDVSDTSIVPTSLHLLLISANCRGYIYVFTSLSLSLAPSPSLSLPPSPESEVTVLRTAVEDHDTQIEEQRLKIPNTPNKMLRVMQWK